MTGPTPYRPPSLRRRGWKPAGLPVGQMTATADMYPPQVGVANTVGQMTATADMYQAVLTEDVMIGQHVGTGDLYAPSVGTAYTAGQLAANAGVVNTVTVQNGKHVIDNFNRASLGSDWTNRVNTVAIYNSVRAYPVGTNTIAVATIAAMNTNDIRVTATAAAFDTTNTNQGVGIGGSDKMCWMNVYPTGIQIGTSTAWNWTTGWVSRASNAHVISPGDRFSLERVGTAFVGLINGDPYIVWNDSGGYIPLDASHRYPAMAFNVGGTNNHGLDDFDAIDLPQWNPNSYAWYYADGFNRADGTHLGWTGWPGGSGWWDRTTNRLRITGNQVYNPDTSSMNAAVWTSPAQFVDGGVGVTLAARPGANQQVKLFTFSDWDGLMALLLCTSDTIAIYTATSWDSANQVQRATWSGTINNGDRILLERRGTTYTAYHDTGGGFTARCSWADTAPVIPRDCGYPHTSTTPNNSFHGLGIYNGGSTTSARVDSWYVYELRPSSV